MPSPAEIDISSISFPLNQEDRSYLCEQLYGWAQNVLRSRVGFESEEYAGIALLAALDNYSPDKGVPFSRYMYRCVTWRARDEIRKFTGRKGSSKYEAQLSASPIIDDAQPAIANSTGSSKLEVEDMVTQICKMETIMCLTALGRLMCKANNEDIARMTGYGKERINKKLALVRELL